MTTIDEEQAEPMTTEEVAGILDIHPVMLPAILGTGCAFYRTADGAIEQRSAEGLVCRWEHAPGGAVHQVVYDRDGNEDTRLLTGLTTLRRAEDGQRADGTNRDESIPS